MIPAPFDYEVADSVESAVELLGSRSDAKLLAGGHSLIPLLRLRVTRPSLLVDVGRLNGPLRSVRDDGDRLAIGALARYADLEREPLLLEHNPLLAHVAGLVGDPQVRHRGTIGGSAAHGDPASDIPTALVALDAELVGQGPDGERRWEAGDFFRSVFQTALGPQDVLTEIRVPKLGDAGWSYLKFTRRAQDWATVGVAALVSGGDRATIALTNMGPTPLRALTVEERIRNGAGIGEAADAAADGTEPPDDTFGSADYRRELSKTLVRRALEEALRR
jgi:carbon-monoxide dehydrogenase medium subunit